MQHVVEKEENSFNVFMFSFELPTMWIGIRTRRCTWGNFHASRIVTGIEILLLCCPIVLEVVLLKMFLLVYSKLLNYIMLTSVLDLENEEHSKRFGRLFYLTYLSKELKKIWAKASLIMHPFFTFTMLQSTNFQKLISTLFITCYY